MKKIHITFYFILLSQTSIFSQNLDINLLTSITNNRNAKFDKPLYHFDQSVYYISIVNPVSVLGAGLIKNDPVLKNKGISMGISLAGSMATTYALKRIINRNRPYITYPTLTHYSIEDSQSMPSGHTTAAFSTATSLTLAFPKWYVATPAYTYAALVGYSRLHLGVHYPSDVLTGAILGTSSAFITHKANKWLQKRDNKQKINK